MFSPSASEWARTPLGLLVPKDVLQLDRQTPSGLHIPNRYGYGKRFDRPTCVGLFVGAGGMSCGLVSAGFHEIAAVEWDASAALTYMTNLGAYPIRIHYVGDGDKERLNRVVEAEQKRHKKEGFEGEFLRSGSGWIGSTDFPGCEDFWFGDIRHVTGAEILAQVGMERGEVDVVAGGPPCQGLTVANSNRRVEDPRNGLLWEYMRLVEEIRPKTFVMENVPPLLTAAKGGFFKAICQKANAAGYDVVANILDAANYGVPQYRRRAFVVGTLPGAGPYHFPLPTNWAMGSRADGSKQWHQLRGERDADEVGEPDDGLTYDAEQGIFTGGVMGERETSQNGRRKASVQAEMEFGE